MHSNNFVILRDYMLRPSDQPLRFNSLDWSSNSNETELHSEHKLRSSSRETTMNGVWSSVMTKFLFIMHTFTYKQIPPRPQTSVDSRH